MMFESLMTLDVSKPILRMGPDGNKPAEGTGVSGSNGGSAGGVETRRDFARPDVLVDDGAGRINGSCESGTGSSFGGWYGSAWVGVFDLRNGTIESSDGILGRGRRST